MLYAMLRAASRVALSWYYSDVIVQGRERIPVAGPVLIVANHPNALVDALLVGTTVDRHVLLTAKATLFEHRALMPLLSSVGVVPLRRARDEPSRDQSRNAQAFQQVSAALEKGRVVLIFPEGISHDEPMLAPLRTGAARIAFEARHTGVVGLRILPIGLVFEEKERPRSRVLVRIGESLDVDAWVAAYPSADAALLTREIDARLRQVTLNFASSERAQRAVRVASALAAIASEPLDLGQTSAFALETDLAARVESAIESLDRAPPALSAEADRFTNRLAALEARLHQRGASLAEARVSPANAPGAWFIIRESAIVLVCLPFAVLGRITHWLPVRAALAFGVRSLQRDPSKDQPAMRTIVIGLGLLLAWYTLQAVVVAWWLGVGAAVAWLVIIFVARRVDLVLADRYRRGRRRALTYLAIRKDPQFRAETLAEIEALLADAVRLEDSLRRLPA